MEHGVAIGTYGAEIVHRINLVFLADLRQRQKVVDMDVASAYFTIDLPKIELAN